MALSREILVLCASVLVGFLGSVVGGFVSSWAKRYVEGESALRVHARCRACGHELALRDMIPVLGWLLLRGRCRYCASRIPPRYLISEIACGLVFAAIAAVYGPSLETLESLVFSSVLLFLTLTDLDDFLIPNGCIVAALGVRVVYMAIALSAGWMNASQGLYYVASALGMGLALSAMVLVANRLFGHSTMGGGDLKLYCVAGLYLGWQQGLLVVVVSCVLGVAMGLMPPVSENSGSFKGTREVPRRSRPFPFGPCIAAACVIAMLFGEPLSMWYSGFL